MLPAPLSAFITTGFMMPVTPPSRADGTFTVLLHRHMNPWRDLTGGSFHPLPRKRQVRPGGDRAGTERSIPKRARGVEGSLRSVAAESEFDPNGSSPNQSMAGRLGAFPAQACASVQSSRSRGVAVLAGSRGSGGRIRLFAVFDRSSSPPSPASSVSPSNGSGPPLKSVARAMTAATCAAASRRTVSSRWA